jgi:hypothetical protein
LQAARLGLRTLIVTQGVPGELRELLAPYRGELEVQVLAAEHTTTLATTGAGAERRQRVLAWAGPIVEPVEVDTGILHLAAVARETPTSWQGDAEFVGVTPQGLLREWDDSGAISLVPLDPQSLPANFDALVVSDIERPFCKVVGGMEPRAEAGTEPRAEAGMGAGTGTGTAAITAGSAPTTVLLPDGTVKHVPVPTIEALPHEDLGAGDVFAAAFFVALHEVRSPAEAAAFGNAAAAVRVSGVGAQAIGDRQAIARISCR